MVHLYTEQVAQTWKKRTRQHLIAALAVAGAGLLTCILLCTQVSTGNAAKMLPLVIGISTLAGWAVIFLLRFGFFPAKAEVRHVTGVMQEETEEVAGILTIDKQRWLIPHSVAFYKVTLREGGERRIFNVDTHLANQLPANGTAVRALVVRKFLTAYEVQHENQENI